MCSMRTVASLRVEPVLATGGAPTPRLESARPPVQKSRHSVFELGLLVDSERTKGVQRMFRAASRSLAELAGRTTGRQTFRPRRLESRGRIWPQCEHGADGGVQIVQFQ